MAHLLRTCRVAYRNPHTCRHTFATRWLRDGRRMDTLAKALGHTSIRTTVDLYAHLATEDVATDLARVTAARESRLRHQSDGQTRMDERAEVPSGLEPLFSEKADPERQALEQTPAAVPELNPFLARVLERVKQNERERAT